MVTVQEGSRYSVRHALEIEKHLCPGGSRLCSMQFLPKESKVEMLISL